MAYTKKTWKNGEVITEAGLNNMEEGIAEALALKDHASNTNNPHSVTAAQVGAAKSDLSNASGTFDGAVKANATAVATLGTAQVRNISINSTDLTASSSALTTGDVYYKYD